jgi:hypothetical protein
MDASQQFKINMKKIIVFLVIVAIIGGCSIMSKTAEPQWKNIESDGNIQIRSYSQTVVAEVLVIGERYKAINNGFRILADYIFGQNKANEKIAMTAPVAQEMNQSNQQWRIRFMMPEGYTLNALPQPNDIRINLIVVPPYRAAVIRFSGFNSDKNINNNVALLAAWITNHNIKTIGQPIYAFYDPPWTLPFFRRNEIMIHISEHNN